MHLAMLPCAYAIWCCRWHKLLESFWSAKKGVFDISKVRHRTGVRHCVRWRALKWDFKYHLHILLLLHTCHLPHPRTGPGHLRCRKARTHPQPLPAPGASQPSASVPAAEPASRRRHRLHAPSWAPGGSAVPNRHGRRLADVVVPHECGLETQVRSRLLKPLHFYSPGHC